MTAAGSGRRGEDDESRGNGATATKTRQGDQANSSAGKRQSGSRSSLAKNKHIIEESIDVGVPRQVAFDQWTQYHDWSKIFKKESAEQKEDQENGSGRDGRAGRADEDNEVTVTAKIGPSQRKWQAEVVAQEPGRRIEWEAKGGVQAKGVVSFHRLDDRLTHVQVVIHYQPSGFIETTGNFLRMPRRRVRKDLKLFKNFIDLRGQATGEGSGRIRGGGLRDSVDQELEQAHGTEDDESRKR